MGTRSFFPGGKWPGCEADHSPPSSTEVKNVSSLHPLPQYIFMAWCLVKHRDNFTFKGGYTGLDYTNNELNTQQNMGVLESNSSI